MNTGLRSVRPAPTATATLAEESGAGLRAAGARPVAEVEPGE